ncbi:MAG: insulinase family protein [Betaproteobacteria bacterium]|nr:insulinase family protein [Betaproteobacteria bacterium]
MLIRSIFSSAVCALVLMATVAYGQPLKPSLDRTLANGMRVLVYENPRAPTALHMVWVKAGSIDEVSGRSGLAHVLEHMMFKGTQNLGPGEFSRRVAALGGRENAFTSKDYTGYFQQVHKDSLREVMRLEADRQRFLKLNDQEFKKEIQVVMEERRLRTDDNPSSLAFQVFQWAQDFYGPMRSRALPARKPQEEPTQSGARRARLKAPAENPFLMMAYKAPTFREALGPISVSARAARDLVALDVLSALLDDPGTGRLVQRLVRQDRIALSFSSGTDGIARGPGLFLMEAVAAPGSSLSMLEQKIKDEIALIAKEGVREQELSRLKRQAKASQVFRQDSMFSIAMEAARLLLAGRELADAERWLQVLEDIRSEDIQRVAQQYFSDDQLTVLEFEPLPLSNAAIKPRPAAGTRH